MATKRSAYFAALGILAAFFPALMLIQSLREKATIIPLNDTGHPYEDWRNCVVQNVELMTNESWIKWPTVLLHCEKNLIFNLNIIDIKWNKEIVRVAVKKMENKTEFKSSILAFGQGLDNAVVENVHKLRTKDFAEFTGGFPFDNATMARYEQSDIKKTIPTTDNMIDRPKPNRTEGWYGRPEFETLISLWREKKLYDAIWLDLAAKEHEILPMSYRNGFMDQNGIVVCQWHAEIHFGQNREEVLEFLWRTVQERRYAIVKPIPPGIFINIKRFSITVPFNIHLINVEDPICRSRYSKKIAGTKYA